MNAPRSVVLLVESNVYRRDLIPAVSRIVHSSFAFAIAMSVGRWKSQIRPLISA